MAEKKEKCKDPQHAAPKDEPTNITAGYYDHICPACNEATRWRVKDGKLNGLYPLPMLGRAPWKR